MTGVMQCLMAAGSGVVINSNNYTNELLGVATNPALNFVTDGTTTKTTGAGTVADSNWATPTTTGIGSSYWLKLTLGSGSGTATGGSDATGVWLALSSTRNYGILAAPAGQVRNRNLTYQIASDSGGVTIVGSGNISLESDRS